MKCFRYKKSSHRSKPTIFWCRSRINLRASLQHQCPAFRGASRGGFPRYDVYATFCGLRQDLNVCWHVFSAKVGLSRPNPHETRRMDGYGVSNSFGTRCSATLDLRVDGVLFVVFIYPPSNKHGSGTRPLARLNSSMNRLHSTSMIVSGRVYIYIYVTLVFIYYMARTIAHSTYRICTVHKYVHCASPKIRIVRTMCKKCLAVICLFVLMPRSCRLMSPHVDTFCCNGYQ